MRSRSHDIVAVSVGATVADDLRLQAELDDLKAAHARALRRLAKRQADRGDLVDAVYRASRDALAGITIAPVPPPLPDKRRRGRETAVLHLSDWQIGKHTADYSIDVAAQRLDLLARKVERIVGIQRLDHPVDHIVIALTGDLVESDGNIFPSQSYEVEAGGLYLQIFRGAEMLATIVRRMAAIFPRVTVRGAIGNHGRIGRAGDHSPESNSDAILMRVAAQMVADESRIDWRESLTLGARHWYDTIDVSGQRILMVHGDQFGRAHGIPNISQKATAYAMSLTPYRYLLYGHHHQPSRMTLADGRITAWCAPSLESGNRFAVEVVGATGSPAQWLLFIDDTGEVSGEYLVRLVE